MQKKKQQQTYRVLFAVAVISALKVNSDTSMRKPTIFTVIILMYLVRMFFPVPIPILSGPETAEWVIDRADRF